MKVKELLTKDENEFIRRMLDRMRNAKSLKDYFDYRKSIGLLIKNKLP